MERREGFESYIGLIKEDEVVGYTILLCVYPAWRPGPGRRNSQRKTVKEQKMV